jgi:hypothetical protein
MSDAIIDSNKKAKKWQNSEKEPDKKIPFTFPIPPRGGAVARWAHGSIPSQQKKWWLKWSGGWPKPMRKHTTRGR